MKKLIVLAALAFALLAGSVKAVTLHSHPAKADPPCSQPNC